MKSLTRRVSDNEPSRRALRCVTLLTSGELMQDTQRELWITDIAAGTVCQGLSVQHGDGHVYLVSRND